MNGHITIKKKNEAYLTLKGDPGVIMEISEHFTFEVPGYKFMPAYKQGRWDGRIRLYDLGKATIYSGLYVKLISFLASRGYTYSLEANGYYGLPGEEDNVSLDMIKEYMSSLNLASKGKPLEYREYQAEGVYIAIKDRRALMKAATGAGKSLIIYCLFRYLLEQNEDHNILLVVPTIGLTTQMLADFKDYSSINGWDADSYVHLISGGKEKSSKKPITVSTWQSIAKMPHDYFNKFTVIACDEAHTLQAGSLTGIFEKATETVYRYGFTGTVQDTKCHALVIQGLTGPIHSIAETKDLIKAKQLTPIKINIIGLKHREEVCKAFKHSDYDKEIGYLVTNERRNKFIRNLALQTEGTCLVLYRFVENQGKPLYNLLKEKSQDREVRFISGEISDTEREEIRNLASSKPIIIVASYGTFKQGVNAPGISSIIFAHPSKGKITNLQSIGRGLRLFEGKDVCKLYDIADNMCYRKYINHTFNHLSERIKQYTTEGFPFTITNIDF